MNWKVRFAGRAAILTLIFLSALAYSIVVQADEIGRWVAHTHEVIDNLKDLEIAMGTLESSVRGFVLTGDDSYMASYRASRESAERSEGIVRRLTVDNALQQRRLGPLETVIALKIESAERAIYLRRFKGLQVAADALPGLHGQQLASEIRAGVGELGNEESRLLALRTRDAKRRAYQTKVILAIGLLAGFLIAAIASWAVRRGNISRGLAEKEMRESEERFRDMANNISQLAWMADEKGYIFWYNQQWFDYTGTTLDEMAGWGWQKVHHPDHVQGVVDKISRCFKSGEIWEDTFPLRGRDGEYRWFLSRAVPIFDAHGKVLRWFGTNTDITECKILEAELAVARDQALARNQELAAALTSVREASAHKSRFLANMSHELRTPLNGIIGFTEMIHDGRVGDVNEMQKDFLNDSLHSARHLLSLINDILDLEKVESGHLVLRPEVFDMNALITETLGEVRAIAASKDVELSSELKLDNSAVFLDRQRTRQILLNLIMNAIKFTPDKGRVTTRLRGAGLERILVEIEDTGIGISEPDQLRLFREFEQIETTASKHFQGTGLGLALTRRMVEAQGGVVSVSSQVGVGSIFSVILPASVKTFTAPEPEPVSPRWSETILVVEDGGGHGDEVPRSIALAVRAAGLSAEESGSIEDALERLERHRYRAVVTALVLPRGTGLDLVQEIRRREHHSDLPVIIATGMPEGLAPQGFMVQDALTSAARPEDIAATLGRIGVTGNERQVLVVDDDPNVHKLVRAALRGTGLEAVCCSDGESGLRALRFCHPSAMVLDLMMPNLDGFSFIARIQDMPGVKNVPVFVWTDLSLNAAELKALSGGVSKIIYKSDGGVTHLIRELEKQLSPPELAPAA